ncbi:MAG: cytochrome c maturation protein CcmE [Sphingomonadaceae bacterium]
MKAKHQRLTLAIAALVAILGSSVLAMSAIGDQASYFYAPGDVARASPSDGKAVRLGGMVRTGSIAHAADGVTLNFVVHDEAHSVPVVFRGIPPDLFKEGSGVVAEGYFANGTFVATNLLAKHDERYMPPKADGTQHKTTSLKQ